MDSVAVQPQDLASLAASTAAGRASRAKRLASRSFQLAPARSPRLMMSAVKRCDSSQLAAAASRGAIHNRHVAMTSSAAFAVRSIGLYALDYSRSPVTQR